MQEKEAVKKPHEMAYNIRARFDTIKQGILLFLEFIREAEWETIASKLQDLEMDENPYEAYQGGTSRQVPVRPTDEEITDCLNYLRDKGHIVYDEQHRKWIFRTYTVALKKPLVEKKAPETTVKVMKERERERRQARFGIIQESPDEITVHLHLKDTSHLIFFLLISGGFTLSVSAVFFFAPYPSPGLGIIFFILTLISIIAFSTELLNKTYVIINKKTSIFSIQKTIPPRVEYIPLRSIEGIYLSGVTLTSKLFPIAGELEKGSIFFLKLRLKEGKEMKICSTRKGEALQELVTYLRGQIRKY